MMTDNDRLLRQHALDLAKAFDVELRIKKGLAPHDAAAKFEVKNGLLTGRQFVEIAPITDETTYAVALHEMGHQLAPCGLLHGHQSRHARHTGELVTKRDLLLRLESERAAWAWAQHHALQWTALMIYVKVISLDSYKRTIRECLRRRKAAIAIYQRRRKP